MEVTLEYNLFATDEKNIPKEKRINPYKVSLASGNKTEFKDLLIAIISKYESETGRQMVRNRPVTAYVKTNGIISERTEGTYFNNNISTVAQLKSKLESLKSSGVEFVLTFL